MIDFMLHHACVKVAHRAVDRRAGLIAPAISQAFVAWHEAAHARD
jgi:hypothetical protein